MRSANKISVLTLLVLALAFGQGCSSSQTSEDAPMEAGGLESGADAVGSIPEDMLASEELPMSGDAATGQEEEPAAAEASPEADPFADLVDGGSATSDQALGVAESDAEPAAEMSGSTDSYTVKPGDTLMKIAFSIYGDIDRWKDLHEWNRATLKRASDLKVGMTLTFEAPTERFQPDEKAQAYTIKPGDTLAGIADEVYGRKMKFKKLQNYNRNLIKNPNRIFAGFTIFYDITPQEMAEAEARRNERMAGGGGEPPTPSSVPSAITPPMDTQAPSEPIAISPSDVGPPIPTQQQ